MPPPLDVDREAVRVLVVAIGPRAAAREMGLPEATVQAWSARFGWLEHVRPAPGARPVSMVSTTVATTAPADALVSAMEGLSTRSKLGFAKASVKVAEKMAEADPDNLVAQGADALTWAKVASMAHGWAGGAGTTVNVAVALRMDME